MVSQREIIKKINEYLTGKISRKDAAKWGYEKLNETTADTDNKIFGALVDLYTLHDEWRVTDEDLQETIKELKSITAQIKSLPG